MYTRARVLKNLKAKVLTVLGCFAMLLGFGAGITNVLSAATEVSQTSAESVDFFLVGHGSVFSEDWSNEGGIQLQSFSGNNGAVLGIYLQAGDVFQIVNTSHSNWYGYSNYKSGTTNFAAATYNEFTVGSQYWGTGGSVTQANYASVNSGCGDVRTDGYHDIYIKAPSWWYNNGFKYGGIHYWGSGDGYPSTSTVYATSGGYKIYKITGIPAGATGLQVYRNNGSTNDAYSQNLTFTNNGNIICKNTGYYDIYLNTSNQIYISPVFTDAVYLDLNGQGWESDSAHIGAHFWNSSDVSVSINVEMTLVHGHGGSTHIFEAPIPSLSSGNPNYVIFYRAASFNPSSMGEWNKTGDLEVSLNKNKFVLSGYTSGSWDASLLTNSNRASYYGTYFNTCVVCSGSGSITTDNWSDAKTEYDNMCANAQGVVWSSTASSSGTALQRAMSKYDYIVFKKKYAGHDDFINRSTSSGKSSFALNIPSYSGQDESPLTLTLWIVLGAGIAGMGAIGAAYFVSKKKKRSQA